MHNVEPYCNGECCGMCVREGIPRVKATHKVGEESVPEGEMRHNYTMYVCCDHFQKIFRLGTDCFPVRISGW